MQRLLFCLLFVSILAVPACAGITYLSWDDISYYSVVGEVDEQNHLGMVWQFSMPAEKSNDTTYTPGIDLSGGAYGLVKSVTVTYKYSMLAVGDTCHVMFWVEQAPLDENALYAEMWASSPLESDFTDSTGTAHLKNVNFGGVRYLRFGVSTTTAHNVTSADSVLTVYITVAPEFWSDFKQGGVLYATDVIQESPDGSGVHYKRGWNEAGDSLITKLVNATTTSHRLRFESSIDATSLRMENLLFLQDSLAAISFGDAITIQTNAGDSLIPCRSRHRLSIESGDSARVDRISREWRTPKGTIVKIEPAWSSAAKKVVFHGSADTVEADGANLLMQGDFVMKVGDMIVFEKITGDASGDSLAAGVWQLWTKQDNIP